jgi:PST family polysaccharide transporter
MNDDSLKRGFVRGVAWSGSARWAAQLITWLSTLFVARLLSPDDYGLVGMATVVFGAITVFVDFGVTLTVVTLRHLTPAQVAQLNGLAALLGLAGFLAAAALAPAAAWFFGRPELTFVLMALATAFLMIGPRQVPMALLQRDMRFRAFAAIEATQALVAAAVTFAAALGGAGFWALVAGVVAGQAAATVFALGTVRSAMKWPRPAELGEALQFTRHQLTGSLAWYAYSNADFAVAGRLLGARELGIYTIAWTFARIVPERLAHLVTRVTPAFFAPLRDDRAALCRWIYALTEALTVLTFPLLVGLALTAPDAVPLLVGQQWTAAVLPLQLLALYSMWDVVAQLLSRGLTAVGDTRFVARLGVALAVVMPPAFIVGSLWGPAGIAAAWVLVNPAVRSVIVYRARRSLGLSARRWIVAMQPAVTSTALMAAAVVSIGAAAAEYPPLVRLLAQIAGGGAVFALGIALLHRERLLVWRDVARRLRSGYAAGRSAAEAAA